MNYLVSGECCQFYNAMVAKFKSECCLFFLCIQIIFTYKDQTRENVSLFFFMLPMKSLRCGLTLIVNRTYFDSFKDQLEILKERVLN